MFSLLPNLAQRSSYFQSASILHTGILFPLTALRTQYFAKYAEELSTSETRVALSAMAKDSSTYLIGGSFPERFGDKLYNTCLVHSPTGELISTHRKIHLFDICIPGNPLIPTYSLLIQTKSPFRRAKSYPLAPRLQPSQPRGVISHWEYAMIFGSLNSR
jgi:apolipoprotein N-acyltransferase